jgi:uncharacterized repeat protein (TIGR02543 family)
MTLFYTYQQLVILPTDPYIEGKIFKGWVLDLSEMVFYEPDLMPAHNMILYAVFEDEVEEPYTNIAAVIVGENDVSYTITGVIIYNFQDFETVIIADQQNIIHIYDFIDAEVGEEVILSGTRQEFMGIIYLENVNIIERLSSNQPIPIPLLTLSLDELFEYDPLQIENIGLYVEVSGYFEENWDATLAFTKISNDNGSIGVMAIDYFGFERLIVNTERNVKLRGFMLPAIVDGEHIETFLLFINQIDDFVVLDENEVSIHFETFGGSFHEPISGMPNDPLDLPTPTREDYIFVGWYEDILYEHPFNQVIFPNYSLFLYAKWVTEEDQELALFQSVENDILGHYQNKNYFTDDTIEFPTMDANGLIHIEINVDEDDLVYFNPALMTFLEADELVYVTFHVILTSLNTQNTYAFSFSVILSSNATSHIIDVINGDIGQLFTIVGLVVYTAEWGPSIMKDDTGYLAFDNIHQFEVGERVMVTVRKDVLGNMTYIFQDNQGIQFHELIANEVELDLVPNHISEADFVLLDQFDSTIYGQYVELQGFIIWNDERFDFMPILRTDSYDLLISVTGHGGFEKLFNHEYDEVLIQGFLVSNGESMTLVYQGIRQDIKYPEHTSESKVDSIVKGLMYRLEYFQPHSQGYFDFMPYHPYLGAEIDWNILDGNTQYFDFVKREIGLTFEPIHVDMIVTVTEGNVSQSFEWSFVIEPSHLSWINDLTRDNIYKYHYFKGVVSYWHHSFMYLMDTNGHYLVVSIPNLNLQVGDEIIIGGYLKRDNNQRVYMRTPYDYERETYIQVLSQNNNHEMQANLMGFETLMSFDPYDMHTYDQYVMMEGYLYYSGGSYKLMMPEGDVYVQSPDLYTYLKLELFENQRVQIDGFISTYANNMYTLYFLGIEGSLDVIDYTDEAKLMYMKDYILTHYQIPRAGNIDFNFNQVLRLFNSGSLTLTAINDVNQNFLIQQNHILAVDELYEATFEVELQIAGLEELFEITMTILPTPVILVTPIEEAILNLGQFHVIEGIVLSSSRIFDDYYLLIEDETEIIFVIVDYQTYHAHYDYYNGYMGEKVSVQGYVQKIDGRYTIEAQAFHVLSRDHVIEVNFDSYTLAEVNGFDLSNDESYGVPVRIEGYIRIAEGPSSIIHYIENDGQIVYLNDMEINYGYIRNYANIRVELIGFTFGTNPMYQTSTMGVMVVDFNYEGDRSIQLKENDLDLIASQVLENVVSSHNQYNPKYFAEEYVWFTGVPYVYAQNFPIVLEYEVVENGEFVEFYDTYLYTLEVAENTTVKILVTVTLGEIVKQEYIYVYLKGFRVGTLEELFSLEPGSFEFALEATYLYSEFGLWYFLIEDKVFALEYYGWGWYSKGDMLYIVGKKNVINGIPGFTYDVKLVEIPDYNAVDMVPIHLTVSELYDNDYTTNPIHQELLLVEGVLGYDAYFGYFTLSEDDHMVYIRFDRYNTYGFDVMSELLGKTIMMPLLMSMQMLRSEYYLFDYMGYFDDFEKPDYSRTERLELSKADFISKFDGSIVYSGDLVEKFPTIEFFYLTVYNYILIEEDEIYLDPISNLFGYVESPVQVTYLVSVSDFMLEETVEFEIVVTLMPRESVSINQIVWRTIYDVVQFEGVVVSINPEMMIIKDETGYLLIMLTNYQFSSLYYDEIVSVGHYVVGVGEIDAHNNHQMFNKISYLVVLEVIDENHEIIENFNGMTIENLYHIDYLNREYFLKPVTFTGTLIYDGSFYIYDEVNDSYGLYKIRLSNYQPYLHDFIGSNITVSGYLFGYMTTFSRFDWRLFNIEVNAN